MGRRWKGLKDECSCMLYLPSEVWVMVFDFFDCAQFEISFYITNKDTPLRFSIENAVRDFDRMIENIPRSAMLMTSYLLMQRVEKDTCLYTCHDILVNTLHEVVVNGRMKAGEIINMAIGRAYDDCYSDLSSTPEMEKLREVSTTEFEHYRMSRIRDYVTVYSDGESVDEYDTINREQFMNEQCDDVLASHREEDIPWDDPFRDIIRHNVCKWRADDLVDSDYTYTYYDVLDDEFFKVHRKLYCTFTLPSIRGALLIAGIYVPDQLLHTSNIR